MKMVHKRFCPRRSAWTIARSALLVLVLLSVRAAAARAAGYSFTGLGDLIGGGFGSVALGVSADGSVVVGYGVSASGYEAFRWTNAGGMVGLKDDLLAHGVENLTGWTLVETRDVSANGNTIVGYGTNPQGQTEAWIATVPEPGSAVLAALAAAGLMIASRLRCAK